jgi:uroporphyrinogen decarboxylase
VSSGCDVVEVGQKYPNLVISGGIDKRELAKGKKEIDEILERIIPAMKKRGGYIPTCDHGVPAEVSLENYLHYRKRSLELGS